MPRVVPGYREEARSRILKAAQAAFSEKGYDQATMEDIAHKLGVSKGALYLYFNSKEQLFEKITEERQHKLRETLRASLKDGALVECTKEFFDAVIDQQDKYNISLTFEVISEAARNDALRAILLEDYDKRLRILSEFLHEQQEQGLIRDDVDVHSLSLGISALFNGLMMSHILGIEKKQIKRTWMETINIIYSAPVQARPLSASPPPTA
jgi:AcrR family transcriptional regulator